MKRQRTDAVDETGEGDVLELVEPERERREVEMLSWNMVKTVFDSK